jgi:hypothetical protein
MHFVGLEEMRPLLALGALLLANSCANKESVTVTVTWEAERDAIPSESHPFAGLWKSNLRNDWGLAIGPYTGNLYYVSFCGPGGCFGKTNHHYRPITSLTNDPVYFRVIDSDTLLVGNEESSLIYFRSKGRAATEPNKNPNLTPSSVRSRLD